MRELEAAFDTAGFDVIDAEGSIVEVALGNEEEDGLLEGLIVVESELDAVAEYLANEDAEGLKVGFIAVEEDGVAVSSIAEVGYGNEEGFRLWEGPDGATTKVGDAIVTIVGRDIADGLELGKPTMISSGIVDVDGVEPSDAETDADEIALILAAETGVSKEEGWLVEETEGDAPNAKELDEGFKAGEIPVLNGTVLNVLEGSAEEDGDVDISDRSTASVEVEAAILKVTDGDAVIAGETPELVVVDADILNFGEVETDGELLIPAVLDGENASEEDAGVVWD